MPKKIKSARAPKIKPINNFLIMFVLSLFQITTGFIAANCGKEFEPKVIISLLSLVAVEWLYLIVFYTALHRRNFELEIIAFFLTGVGLVAVGSQNSSQGFKQCLMAIGGLCVFIFMVFLLGHVDFCMKIRIVVAVGALALLLVNLVIAKTYMGARNWIEIGGITVQPSEFVKIAFIFVGSATLEKIQTSKNIIAFIGFSLAVVG